MKYVDEFRDAAQVKTLSQLIKQKAIRPYSIMEICGGQTHSILKYGIEEFLPDTIRLIHGPGCPVCVTPLEMIDKALAIASLADVIFTTFGDMLRVPGSGRDLLSVKAAGGDVRMIYSPLDAVKIAVNNPLKKVVFFGVGFETTSPANAMAVKEAKRLNLKNFSVLCSQVLVPPAIRALLTNPEVKIDGFLAAGHVCAVMGYEEYISISEEYSIPIVVTGFEPVDILHGILTVVEKLNKDESGVENAYSRVVAKEGNINARNLLEEVFEITDRKWRGIGNIPSSGFRLRSGYADYDAEKIFDVGNIQVEESGDCIAGQVLQGIKRPYECSAFGNQCTPQSPLGAPMVSSEGACAAYFRYRHHAAGSPNNHGMKDKG